jgi:hypothetical protein
MKKTILALSAVAMLGACTTTQKVSVTQPGDRVLTCAQLRSQFAELDAIREDGQHDQGVNVANAAAILLFWPAAAGNYLSARDAIKMADDRKTHLMQYYNEKNCDNAANAEVLVSVPGMP